MKLEWEGLIRLLQDEQARLLEGLLDPNTDFTDTQFIRGQIDALKWVIDTPRRQEEEDEYERQRETDG